MIVLYGIAIAFLIFFIIRIIFPKMVPYIKAFLRFVIRIIQSLLRLIADTLTATVYLLMTKTIKIVGSVVLITIVITLLLATRQVIEQTIPSLWKASKEIFLPIYVTSFFVITLSLGLIRTLRRYYFNRKMKKMNRKKQTRNYNF